MTDPPTSPALSRRAALGLLPMLALTTQGCGWLGGDAGRYAPGRVILATGGTAGVYFAFGSEIAAVAARILPDAPLEVVSTSGSVENLHLAAEGPRVLAFSAQDAAAEAVRGSGPFERALPLTALARVYDDYLHVVARASSPVRTLDDLRGRSVSLGSTGSGTELIARRLLEVVGIDLTEIIVLDLGIDESLGRLADGGLDAFFWSGGLPTGGVARLNEQVPLRLLPVQDPVAEMRRRFSSAYRPAVVPPDVYGLDEQVATLAVPNLLMTHERTDTGLVEAVTRLLFDQRRDIADTVPLAGALDRRSAIYTDPVPLHPGALAYYRAAAD